MSLTAQFFEEIGRRGGTEDRPFVDANEIADELGMNDTDLIAAIEALEFGNLIEDVDRDGETDVRFTPRGLDEWQKRSGTAHSSA